MYTSTVLSLFNVTTIPALSFFFTSIGNLSIVDSNNNLIDSYEIISKNDHSSSLLVNIDNLLKKNNLNIKNITKIVCGIGPGSYTGTRVGLTIAKSLAFSLKIDLHYISSLVLL